MVAAGTAMCVPGNHDVKLMRKLRGKNVQVRHGLAETLADFEKIDPAVRPAFERDIADFIDGLVSHYVLDGGRLVVAHAGMKQEYQGRGSGKVREFALYGETTGEIDDFGLPVRADWAAEYRGEAKVVYGHTPVARPQWVNQTINIDTGCVFGGSLTALRYPEMETLSVRAERQYCEPAKPFLDDPSGGLSGQQAVDDLLDADDVLGKRIISTRLRHSITIRQENATAALEVISRFAVDPKWLIYLPPTMSPPEASSRDGFLEPPDEAFGYYRGQGVTHVVAQRKHMGSRAVVVLARDVDAARVRFGVIEGQRGVIVTRTGRRFFNDAAVEAAVLDRLGEAMEACDFWNRHRTDWVCLDCELMPWSAKAQDLLRSQYAAVGAAAGQSLPATAEALTAAAGRLEGDQAAAASAVLGRVESTQVNVERFVQTYRGYCWDVGGIDDYKIAPFHVLATAGGVHVDRDHRWHMEEIATVCRQDPALLLPTDHRVVQLSDQAAVRGAVDWWLSMTAAGGEGMVVKPLGFVAKGKKGVVQPAVKCRGQDYLRIIYGPDYDTDENLKRLRGRSVGRKRALALSEFALGVEALERFVAGEPLRRVHECIFGVLAMESEPVDPRL